MFIPGRMPVPSFLDCCLFINGGGGKRLLGWRYSPDSSHHISHLQIYNIKVSVSPFCEWGLDTYGPTSDQVKLANRY